MRLLTTLLHVSVLSAALLAVPASGQDGSPGAATTAPADAWPQFRGNPSLTGVSEATLAEELTLLWTYEADEAIDSSAAIADGTEWKMPATIDDPGILDVVTEALRALGYAGGQG